MKIEVNQIKGIIQRPWQVEIIQQKSRDANIMEEINFCVHSSVYHTIYVQTSKIGTAQEILSYERGYMSLFLYFLANTCHSFLYNASLV